MSTWWRWCRGMATDPHSSEGELVPLPKSVAVNKNSPAARQAKDARRRNLLNFPLGKTNQNHSHIYFHFCIFIYHVCILPFHNEPRTASIQFFHFILTLWSRLACKITRWLRNDAKTWFGATCLRSGLMASFFLRHKNSLPPFMVWRKPWLVALSKLANYLHWHVT